MLQSMGWQRVKHDLVSEQLGQELPGDAAGPRTRLGPQDSHLPSHLHEVIVGGGRGTSWLGPAAHPAGSEYLHS